MKKFILAFFIILFMSSCTTETPIKEMTPDVCKEAGGNWNECGSPCAGTDAEMCIEVCEPMCECGGIAGFVCPKGYKCRLSNLPIMDEIGKCILA